MARLGAGRRGVLAPALPIPYPVLNAAGLRPRRGQTSLTVAASGVGKSQLWGNIAHRTGVPTIYWSADTDEHDVTTRAMALWSGTSTEQIDEQLRNDAWRKYYDEILRANASHVDYVFDAQITPRIVAERLKAFAEVNGEYPHLFVIDNLSNTVQNQDSVLSEQTDTMVGLQRLARESGTHIAILAHAKGEYEGGMKPIPLNGVLNNLGKYVETVITMHRQDDAGRFLGLNLAKNRGGKGADPAARHPVQLEVDFSIATVKGFR